MSHLDEQATRLEAETERRNDIRVGESLHMLPFSLKKERKGKERWKRRRSQSRSDAMMSRNAE